MCGTFAITTTAANTHAWIVADFDPRSHKAHNVATQQSPQRNGNYREEGRARARTQTPETSVTQQHPQPNCPYTHTIMSTGDRSSSSSTRNKAAQHARAVCLFVCLYGDTIAQTIKLRRRHRTHWKTACADSGVVCAPARARCDRGDGDASRSARLGVLVFARDAVAHVSVATYECTSQNDGGSVTVRMIQIMHIRIWIIMLLSVVQSRIMHSRELWKCSLRFNSLRKYQWWFCMYTNNNII